MILAVCQLLLLDPPKKPINLILLLLNRQASSPRNTPVVWFDLLLARRSCNNNQLRITWFPLISVHGYAYLPSSCSFPSAGNNNPPANKNKIKIIHYYYYYRKDLGSYQKKQKEKKKVQDTRTTKLQPSQCAGAGERASLGHGASMDPLSLVRHARREERTTGDTTAPRESPSRDPMGQTGAVPPSR